MPPTHLSLRRETLKLNLLEPDDRIDHQQHAEHDRAVTRIGTGQQPDASQIPITVPTISGHSRRTMSRR